MFILDKEKLEKLKKMILERTICNLKIKKVGQRYYCEHKTTNYNPSSKLMELHEMLCKIDLSDESITDFCLYYDQVLDDIISTIITSKTENNNSKYEKIPKIEKAEELDYYLRTLVSYFEDNQVTKIGVTIDENTYNVPIISILNNMHYIIEDTEKNKNS